MTRAHEDHKARGEMAAALLDVLTAHYVNAEADRETHPLPPLMVQRALWGISELLKGGGG